MYSQIWFQVEQDIYKVVHFLGTPGILHSKP